MDSRVQDLNSLLSVGSDDVRMIGIYGMGGIGKTTIAKAVYNHIFLQFEGSCFLANVREVAEQFNGLVQLQEQLLSELSVNKHQKIGNVHRGINLMRERLCSKRVLIVLDDLDQLSQLYSLAGNRDWFGSGSRIIITTRDEHLLKELKVEEKYEAKGLDYVQSLQLFSWHAFGEANPLENYAALAHGIVSYAGGVPLALEVLGSYLSGRNMLVWKSAFQKLQHIPHNQIQKKLRVSFDALDDDKTKGIFLDIACFFIGTNKDYAITILDGCGFFSEIGISDLISRCLLKINEKNELRMHDIIRDMGREIVREESPMEPGKRSRLWFHEDVCDVLERHKGTEAVEGVVLPIHKRTQWDTKAFARMRNLRLLQINAVHLSGNFDHLSEELRWLCWHYCPLKCLPSNFHLEKLVTLDMQYSSIKILWQNGKFLKSLKILNLSYSKYLTKTPDFTELPKLEKLLLGGCTSLLEVHASIGLLDKLDYLNLEDCKNLRDLPDSIGKLKSVKYLNLSGCSNLEELPEHFGHMESLTELLADGTAIRQLPSSFGLLKNLVSFSLAGRNIKLPTKSLVSYFSSWFRKGPTSTRFLPSTISGLCSLRSLILSDCNLSDGDIPVDIGGLSTLQELDIAGNNFHSLPSGLSHLCKLETFWLRHCTNLQSLPELPPNLRRLHASECISLEKLSNLSNLKTALTLILSNCNRLVEVPGLESLDSVRLIHMDGCNSLENTFKDNLFKGQSDHGLSSIFLPGHEIPSWFSHQTTGSSITFDMPLQLEENFEGITIGAVYADVEERPWLPLLAVRRFSHSHAIFTNKTTGDKWNYAPTELGISKTVEEHVWVSHIPKSYFRYQIKGGDQVEVSIEIYRSEVKKCGIHLINKPEVKDDDDRVQFSYANTDKFDIGTLMHEVLGDRYYHHYLCYGV